jgi:hypothetical protein
MSPSRRRTQAVQRNNNRRRQVPVADTSTEVKLSTPASGQQKKVGQSVRAPTVNSQPLDNMLRVVTVVQQSMEEFNDALSEEEKIMAITKILLNLMNQNGQ